MTRNTAGATTPEDGMPEGGVEIGGHPLADDVNWLLHRAALGIGQVRTRVLADLGLTVREAVLLAVLKQVPGQTQSELASLIRLDKSVFTTTMDGLERRGLITRRADPKDRRVRRPELTEEGRVRCEEADGAYAAAQADVLAALPPDSRTELIGMLQALVFGPFAEAISFESPSARL